MAFAMVAIGSFSLPLALGAGQDGTGAGVVLTIVSLGTLGFALRSVFWGAQASSALRLASALLAFSALWLPFMLAVMTLSPGAPLVHAEVTSPGTTIPVKLAAAGQRVTLVVRGAISDGLADTVHFTVAVSTVEIRGRLFRSQRSIQIAGRRARVIDADATFAQTFDMPQLPNRLTVTALEGPLKGPLVVELFARRGGQGAMVAILVAATLLVSAAERMLDARGYAPAIVAGMGASALVAARAAPGWRLEPAIMSTAFGAIGGLFVGLTSVWILGRLRWRSAKSAGGASQDRRKRELKQRR